MKKQTAVEWYENEINTLIEKYENKEISKSDFIVMKHNLFYPAKAMEKQQILDAHWDGSIYWDSEKTEEEYYTKTYGGDK